MQENYTFAISIELKIVLVAMWLRIKSFILTSKDTLLVAKIIIRKDISSRNATLR